MLKSYADAFVPNSRMRLGTLASAQLDRIKNIPNLIVGKVAPEIVGEDIDGKPLKLSDYRGKVVVLTFWGHWCGPCRAMYPHERTLVQRLGDKPFALLGINSDSDRDDLQKTVKKEKMTWRNVWDFSTDGPISTSYNVSSSPAIYVLDHNGVIRNIGPRGDNLDAAVDALLAELAKEKNGS